MAKKKNPISREAQKEDIKENRENLLNEQLKTRPIQEVSLGREGKKRTLKKKRQ